MKTTKKITIMTILFVIINVLNVSAQKKWSLSAGVLVVPQMKIDLQDLSKGTTPIVGIVATISVQKENNMFAINYFASDAVGILYLRTLPKNYVVYSIIQQNIFVKSRHLTIGGGYQINSQLLFIEAGTGLGNVLSPSISLGVVIPIKVKLSK